MLISSPRPYGPVPAGLLKDLGIDAKGLSAKYPNDPLYRSRNLGNATWFDKETFGADKLVKMRSAEHTSELPSLMRNSYAVFCLKKITLNKHTTEDNTTENTRP